MIKNENIINSLFATFTLFLSLFDISFIVLVGLQLVDLLTGLLANKCDYKSAKLFNGICKKIYMLMLVTMCVVISRYFKFSELKTLITFYYISYESLSILENGDKLGVEYPKFLKKFFKSKISEVDNSEKKES